MLGGHIERSRSQPLRVGTGFQVLKAHKLARPFIPEFELPASKTRPQGDRWRSGKRRVSSMAELQIIIWNARTKMVDVMETNATRKPLQYLR